MSEDEDDDYETKHNLRWNAERREKEYLIDREGKMHKYQGDLSKAIYSFHYAIAEQVLGEDFENPEDHLYQNLGWIMVGSSVYNCAIIDKEPSQKQIDVLFDLGLYDRFCIHKGNQYPQYKDTLTF